jgi:hypothetical protein
LVLAFFVASLPAWAATAPVLQFSPSGVNFGAVKVGQSAGASVVVSNSGTARLLTRLIQITGTQRSQFSSNDRDWYSLAPGASVKFTVTYKPTVAGSATASFQVTSNDPRGVLGITLTGQGTTVTAVPNLTVSPTSLSFGSVAVGGTSAASTVQLSNTGTAALSVTSLALTGANTGCFTLSAPALPLQIAAGASASVSVMCNPTASGARAAALSIGSNNPGGTVTVALSGQGTAPNLTVSPTSVSCASAAVGATSAASTVQLSNTGTAALSVTSLTLTGANASEFVLSATTLPLQIAAGASSSVSVMCKPTAAGARTATLAIGSTNPGGTVTVPLSGQGTTAAAPKAQLSPTSLDFGAVAIGQSAAKTFTVLSVGTQTLQTSNIQITGAQAAAFTSNDADWYTLGAGISVTFSVTFTPTAAGAANAQIEVTSNDPAGKTILPLTGSGTGTATTAPALAVSPASVSFGSVAVGATSAASTVTLSNTGTAALSVTALTLGGTNAAEFTRSTPALPLQIAAGASSSLSLTFKPTASGARTASLTIASNNPAGNVSVALTGSGTATTSQPLLQVAPASVSFGSVAVGATSAASTVQLSNTGTAALSITSLTLSGTNAAEFTRSTPALPLQIAAGASSSLTLTFKPTASGTRTASLTIASNNPAGNVTVAITGTAPAAPGTGYPNDGSVLGTNLSPISDWSPEWAFVDCFKTSRDWVSGELWVFQDSRTLPLDANGWPTSLQSGQVARSLLFWEQVNTYPSGDYIVLYDGAGTLAYQGAATKKSGTAGRDVVTVDASKGGWQLLITATTPGNHVRNVRVLMPGGASATDLYSWYGDAASCPSGDYRSFEQTYQTQPFHPMFLDTIKNYKVLRFMDWMDTNNSEQVNWTDRPTPADARWSLKGVPVETMCALANTIHADPWFNLPHLASDDYLAKFAAVVRDQLTPDLHAYIEYSNEVWNGQFLQAGYAQQRGVALGLDSNAYVAQSSYTSLRSVQMFSIFEQVLGGTSRLKRVMATQAAGWYLGEVQLSYNNAYQHADVLAIAPYFGTEYGSPTNAPNTQNMTVAQLLASINSTELPTVYTWMDANAKLAAKYGLELVAYEGGQSLMGYWGTENNDTLTALYNATNRDPGMGQIYANYLTKWRSYGGGMFIHYLNCLNNTKWGYWGTIERLDQTQTPKFTAIQQFIENHR